MKVAIVSRSSGFQGGIERYAFDVARSLRARGHRVVLWHGGEPGRDDADFAAGFDEVAALSDAGRPGVDVAYVQNSWDPDGLGDLGDTPVVFAAHDHDHTCVRRHRYLPLGHAPCHAAPGLGCVTQGCVVVRNREPGLLPISLRSPFGLRDRLQRTVARGPMVACSAYVGERLIEAGAPSARVHVVHPIPPPDDAPRSPLPEARRLLVAAQLIRGKGVDVAVEAMSRLPEEVTLEVVGDGPARAELTALAARVAPGRVHFLGYQRPDAMPAAYDRARIVVVPSRWPEPFGLIGIEAMRRSRPVVGARHGGIPEWAPPEGRGGRTFAPGDAADLASAVESLLRDPDAGKLALAHVERAFCHADAIGALLEVLTTEAARGAPSAGAVRRIA